MLPIIGDLITAGTNLIKSYFPPDLSPEQKAKLEQGLAEAQNQLTNSVIKYHENEIEQKASIIRAEAQGDSWVQKSWRPITMLVFVFIIANNYILFPYISLFGGKATTLAIPPDMWSLLKLGLSGYVVGRSVEKSIKYYKGLQNEPKR